MGQALHPAQWAVLPECRLCQGEKPSLLPQQQGLSRVLPGGGPALAGSVQSHGAAASLHLSCSILLSFREDTGKE